MIYTPACKSVGSIGSTSCERTDTHLVRCEYGYEVFNPRPLWSWATTVEIEGRDPCLRIGMARQVRFSEQENSSDSSRWRKPMPSAFADDVQVEVEDDAVANLLQRG